MWYHKIREFGKGGEHIYISCFCEIKQQQESEDKYQETVKILESGCLREKVLEMRKETGMAIFSL